MADVYLDPIEYRDRISSYQNGSTPARQLTEVLAEIDPAYHDHVLSNETEGVLGSEIDLHAETFVYDLVEDRKRSKIQNGNRIYRNGYGRLYMRIGDELVSATVFGEPAQDELGHFIVLKNLQEEI